VRRPALEAAGLAAALALAWTLRATTPDAVEDLRPRPDAVEYEEAARHLVRGDGYWLVIAGERYPPRYPFGMSALIAPALVVLGDEPGTGVAAVRVAAAAGTVATWALARAAGGPAAAFGAALLFATAPLHVRLSKLVLSEVPSAAAVAVVALLCLRAASRGTVGAWLAAGAGVGLAATLRLSNVLLLVPAAAVILTGRRRVASLAALGAGALLGVAPLLVQQWLALGSPLATGYAYWLPGTPFFGAAHVLGPPAGGGMEPNALFYGAALAGARTSYGPGVALLVAAGLVLGLRRGGRARTLALFAATFVAALWAFHAFFFWQAERFLVPALPLVAAVAALPLAPPSGLPIRGVALVLVALAVARPFREPAAFAFARGPREVAALRRLAAETPRDAAVLARANPFLFERLLRAGGADRVWVPLDLCEWLLPIRWHGLRSFGRVGDGTWMHEPLAGPRAAADAARTVRALLTAGRPVYLAGAGEAGVMDALRREFVLADAPGGAVRVLLR
jgi:hypothetical protein